MSDDEMGGGEWEDEREDDRECAERCANAMSDASYRGVNDWRVVDRPDGQLGVASGGEDAGFNLEAAKGAAMSVQLSADLAAGDPGRAERCAGMLNAAAYRGLKWEASGPAALVGRYLTTADFSESLTLNDAEETLADLLATLKGCRDESQRKLDAVAAMRKPKPGASALDDERKSAERRAVAVGPRWVLTAVGDGMKSRWNFDGEAEARAKYAERVERGDSAVALYRLDPTLVATTETEAAR